MANEVEDSGVEGTGADTVTDVVVPAAEAAAPEVAAALAEAPVAKPARKPRAATPAAAAPAKPVAKRAAKPRPVAKKSITKKAAPKPAPEAGTVHGASAPSLSQLKDKIMATKKNTEDFAALFTGNIAGVQEKAKEAFEKTTAALTEATDFAKGNVEAVVESGKIVAEALKDMGSTLAADGKAAFETLTADAKELAAVKSPADFFKLQGEIMRRNFDTAVAYGSKNTEMFMKLAGDASAPISTRVSAAMAKIKQAA